MPTISPQIRPSIGGTPEAKPYRPTIQAQTGMARVPSPQIGQSASSEETTPAPAVTLSPQLTALARRQQKLQQEIQAQRDKEAAWEKQKSEYLPKSALKDKAQKNVDEALAELGLDYEQLTQLKLAQLNGADPIQEVRQELQQLKDAQTEQTNKQYEATIKQYRAEADALTAADTKAYHFINREKRQDAVVQHIVDTWQDNPDKVLTVEQAAKEIEEFLREDAKEKANYLKEIDEGDTTQAPQQKTLPPPQKAAPRTLTNAVETAPTRTYGQFQHLSMKERIAQAIARAQR